MKDRATAIRIVSWLAVFGLMAGACFAAAAHAGQIQLPAPRLEGGLVLEQALAQRRTCRSFASQPLNRAQLSQLLWAAYGITAHRQGHALKTVPSAGALYPLDVFAVVGQVTGIPAGVYSYRPSGHCLVLARKGDQRLAVARSSLGQMWAAEAPLIIAIAAQYPRVTKKYGSRGVRYAHMESGCVAQNLFLQAQSLGLRAGIIGAFDNSALAKALGLPDGRDPLLIMPFGHGR